MNKAAHDDHYFEKGLPVHRLSYCAFLDVLGFSERIRRAYQAGMHDQLLAFFHSNLSRAIERLKKECDETMLYSKSFTDNVIIAHPEMSDDMEYEFGSMVLSLKEYQFNMACGGFFVRGGLAIGPLFLDDNSVFGPALLEAYELESKVAVNPIVVLSGDTMEFVKLHLTYYHGMQPPQDHELLRAPDGRVFINYLTEAVFETSTGGETLAADALARHRDCVVSQLKEHRKNPRVFEKFAWLASYHNHFCEQVAHLPTYTPQLKVPGDAFALKFTSIAETDA